MMLFRLEQLCVLYEAKSIKVSLTIEASYLFLGLQIRMGTSAGALDLYNVGTN